MPIMGGKGPALEERVAVSRPRQDEPGKAHVDAPAVDILHPRLAEVDLHLPSPGRIGCRLVIAFRFAFGDMLPFSQRGDMSET